MSTQPAAPGHIARHTAPPTARHTELPAELARPIATTLAAFEASRPRGAEEDVHMVAAVVDCVVTALSAPSALVVDPFAGFGTTLARAAALGRRAFGVELLPERVELVRRRVPSAQVIEGDARELLHLARTATPAVDAGSVDLILTSPPYMTANNHPADPLTAYEHDTGDYARYLAELGLVAAQCARLVRRGGFVVWNVADIRHRGQTTHLIADCGAVLDRHFTRVGVTEIAWDTFPHDLVADALLVFQRQ